MIRNLKALGLAVVAIFAMTAIAASGAQAAAAHFTADSNTANVILTAEADPTASTQSFITDFGEVECTMFKGHATVAKTTETITLTGISYFGTTSETNSAHCEAFGLKAVIEFGGCDYLFHAGTFNGAPSNDATGTVDLVCPAGQSVVINAGGGLCKVTVEPQNGLGTVTYTNVAGAPADVTVDANITGIKYTGIAGFCGGATRNNGVYNGKATVKAYEDAGPGFTEGAQVPATVTST